MKTCASSSVPNFLINSSLNFSTLSFSDATFFPNSFNQNLATNESFSFNKPFDVTSPVCWFLTPNNSVSNVKNSCNLRLIFSIIQF